MDTRLSGSPDFQFAEIVSDEEAWIFTAVDLLGAAEALVPEVGEYWRIENQHRKRREQTGKLLVSTYTPDPRSIYLMLVAYAIENLCKGFLVKKNTPSIWTRAVQDGKLPPDLKGHDLNKLLAQIQFPMSPEDRELAFRLERAAVWSARYPVPVSADGKAVFFEAKMRDQTVPVWHREDDVAVVTAFVSRVRGFIQERTDDDDDDGG